MSDGLNHSGQQVLEFDPTVGDGVIAVQQYSVSAANSGIYEISLTSSVFVDSTQTMGASDFLNLCVSTDPDSMGVTARCAQALPDGSMLTLEAPGTITLQDYELPFVQMDAASYDSIPSVGEAEDAAYGGPDQTVGQLTVTGRFMYWVGNTANGPVYAPLVNATVFIMDNDHYCGTDDELARIATNSQGYYTATVPNGDCDGTVDVYAKAQLDNSHIHVSDRDLNGGATGYKFYTSVHDDAGSGTLDLGTFICGGSAAGYSQRACSAFVDLNAAWSALYASGYSMFELRAWYGPGVTLYVDDGSHDVHTFYQPEYNQIVLGDPLRAAYFDDVVHEYGHAVQDMFGDLTSSSTCSSHDFGQIINERCAWEEGFADFFPLTVQDDQFFDGGGGTHYMELVPDTWESLSSANALKTEDAVARALYDLYDNAVDNVAVYPWLRGQDNYSSLATIYDVLQHYVCQNSFSVFWAKWAQSGHSMHYPVQAIRLNQIDFNTVPVWVYPIPNQLVAPEDADTIAVFPHVYDTESLDDQLTLTVYSNSNSQVHYSWIGAGKLRATFSGTTGQTNVRLRVSDGLGEANSNQFVITWGQGGGGGKEGGGGEYPCESPCNEPGISPKATFLGPAAPNPFNPRTEFFYDLDSGSHVFLAVYDVSGRRVRTFVDRQQNLGRYDVSWDGRDDRGSPQSSGVYFVVLRANGQQFSSKLVLLK